MTKVYGCGAEPWMRELVDSPYLEDAQELIDALPLPVFLPAPRRYEDRQSTFEIKLPPGVRKRPARESNLWRSVSNIAFYAALAAIVVGAVLLGGRSGGRTQFFGFSYYEVLSGSMESMIPKGSLVIIRQTPSKEIRPGDVITFLRSDEETVTHQVLEVLPDFDGNGTLGFRTKGTDNLEPDPDVTAAVNVLGVVKAHVPTLGFTLRWVSDNIKYVFILFILVILISIALRVLLGERGVQQPVKGCGHKYRRGGVKNRPKKGSALCKWQPEAARAAGARKRLRS